MSADGDDKPWGLWVIMWPSIAASYHTKARTANASKELSKKLNERP